MFTPYQPSIVQLLIGYLSLLIIHFVVSLSFPKCKNAPSSPFGGQMKIPNRLLTY